MSQCQLSRDKYDSGGTDYAPGGKILAFFRVTLYNGRDDPIVHTVDEHAVRGKQHQAELKVPSHMRARTKHSTSFISFLKVHMFFIMSFHNAFLLLSNMQILTVGKSVNKKWHDLVKQRKIFDNIQPWQKRYTRL